MYTHLQIWSGCIKETLTEFKFLDGKIDIVAIGELIEGGWNTGTLLNPGKSGQQRRLDASN